MEQHDPAAGAQIDWRAKSFPPVGRTLRLDAVGSQRWSLFDGDFWFPVLVLKEDALAHNLARMARFCAAHGAALAPHGKTTMSPQIIARQLAQGAWGITAATVWQARVFREFGVRRVLLANEVVEPAALQWVAETAAADPGFTLICYVDSPAGVALMDKALAAAGARRRLPVLIERGIPGGRTGCRTQEQVLATGRAVLASRHLEAAGVAGFEGIINAGGIDPTIHAVDGFLFEIREATIGLARLGAFATRPEVIVTVGGSSWFDRVVERLGGSWDLDRPVNLVLRSGCYVTHDSGMYDAVSPLGQRDPDPADRFRPALELWGAVVSRPEPGLALVNFGKRDAAYDAGLPVPHTVRDRAGGRRDVTGVLSVFALNDQHGYVRVPADDPLAIGEFVGCGISHPCTAFDKWRLIPVVDEDYRVIDAVETVF